MRAIDWARRRWGRSSVWPQSLKTCVRIMLTSRQPMFVWWGEELINLYNDAYKCDRRRQASRRRSVSRRRVVWREIWDQVGPRADSAMREQRGHLRRGAAAHHGAQRLPGGDLLHLLLQPGARTTRAAPAASSAPTPTTPQQHHRRAPAGAAARARRRAPPTRARSTRRCARGAHGLATNPRDLPFALDLPRRRRTARPPRCARRVGHRARPRGGARRPSTLDGAPSWPLADGAARSREPVVVERSGARASARCRRAPGIARRAGASSCPSRARARRAVAACSSSGSTPTGSSTTATAASSTWSPGRSSASIANAQAYEEETQARRGAGRARPRQDRVLLQRQPRVPHAADADARPGRGRARPSRRR